MRVLISGNLGFIGSHFVGWVLANDPNVQVVGFGRYSDQRNLKRLNLIDEYLGLDLTTVQVLADEDIRMKVRRNALGRFQQIYGDLTDAAALSGLCEGIETVIHFAAKTFVDHALRDPAPFVASNIQGTHALLNEAERQGVRTFVQVSTDEVYGQILEGRYREDAPLNPRNPYAWTKAAADLDVVWRTATRRFRGIITRTENNYGPYQHRQKAIPTFVRHAMAGEPIPVYGDGLHVRCWLHVEDHCRAIWHLVQTAAPAGIYHVAGEQELTNLDLARIVLAQVCRPMSPGSMEDLCQRMIRFLPDENARPGHDRRYALDVEKLKATGWAPKWDLTSGLQETIRWYVEHAWWLR